LVLIVFGYGTFVYLFVCFLYCGFFYFAYFGRLWGHIWGFFSFLVESFEGFLFRISRHWILCLC
jgi:hypothetical protein